MPVFLNGAAFRKASCNGTALQRIFFNGAPVWSGRFIVVGAGAAYTGGTMLVQQPNGGTATCSGDTSYWKASVQSRESVWGNSDAAVFTAVKLPTSQYSKLTVTWEHYAPDQYATHGVSHFGLTDSTQIIYHSGYPSGGFLDEKFVSKTGTDNGWSTDEIDLSDVDSDHYLGMIVSSGAGGLESFRSSASANLIILSNEKISV